MGNYSIFSSDGTRRLDYGWSRELGYFCSESEVSPDGEELVIGERDQASSTLTPRDLAEILENWDSPREHLLAVLIEERF